MSLTPLDYLVIALYAGVIAAITWRCGRKATDTADDYFIAGRSMPGWAVAMAMMAALISSNTMVGHPATAYQKGLILLLGSLTLPLVLLFVAKVIVPFYRQTIALLLAEREQLRALAPAEAPMALQASADVDGVMAAAASLILALGLVLLTLVQLRLTRASDAGQKAR